MKKFIVIISILIIIIILLLINNYAVACVDPYYAQGQHQLQAQGQLQGQNQSANGTGIGYGGSGGAGGIGYGGSAEANNSLSNDIKVNIKQTTQRPLLPLPEINPIQNQLIQGVLEMTNKWTQYDIPCLPLEKEDRIKVVLNVEDGTFLTSIRIEEIDQVVIDGCHKALSKKVKFKDFVSGPDKDMYKKLESKITYLREPRSVNPDKVRYRVWMKPASKGAGIGGGATYGNSELGASSGYASALGILPGFAVSTVDPAFVVIYYLVR